MKLDKQGKYRFNMYLNPKLDKDKVIIEYLAQRYSAQDFIKETLYSIATGQNITTATNTNNSNEEIAVVEIPAEEYDDIKGLNDIEL